MSILSSCKFTLTGARGHQLIELRIMREAIDERHQRRAVFDQPAACISVGDIAHLLAGNIQEFGQLTAVGCRLVEHDDKLGVREHGAGLDGIQQILYILGNGGGIGISLAELSPGRVKELGRELIFKHHVELIDKHVGSLALFPVECYTVEHGVSDDQQAGGFKLCAKAVNVKDDNALPMHSRYRFR